MQKRQEVPLEDKMVLHRPDHLPMEFLNPNKGKKFLEVKTTRALQSKINLKFPLANATKEKPKMKPSIKQSIIDDFEKTYAMNCDQDRQRKKNRNVSWDSVFNPANKPPIEHIAPDPKVLEKPCRINMA